MISLGLTGSIGMGKSTTAAMFRDAGIAVYDADAAVHEIYAQGGAAVGPLSDRFEGIVQDGAVDRVKLREIVINDAAAMADLEKIVHPLVGQAQVRFRTLAQDRGDTVIVLDIPLLFETGGDRHCTFTAVVTAPAIIQRERVLSRDGMTEHAFTQILEKQMPDDEKRSRADFVLSSAFGLDFTRVHVEAIIALLTQIDSQAVND